MDWRGTLSRTSLGGSAVVPGITMIALYTSITQLKAILRGGTGRGVSGWEAARCAAAPWQPGRGKGWMCSTSVTWLMAVLGADEAKQIGGEKQGRAARSRDVEILEGTSGGKLATLMAI